MKYCVLVSILLLAIQNLASSLEAADAIPSPQIPYQGRLIQAGTVASGNHTFNFSILDSQGNSQWSSGIQTLSVADGLYAVLLGGTGMPPIPATLLGNAVLSVQVTVDGTVVSPNVALVPAMQSLQAWQAVSVVGVVSVANGGTGATSPGTALTNLQAAKSGANSDITSLSALTSPLTISQGGTGATTAAAVLTNLGIDTIATRQSNLTATTPPVATNDGSQGYSVGSIWLDPTDNLAFDCTNAANGAAIWLPLGASSGSVGVGSIGPAQLANGAVTLTSKVSGVLPLANGGTGATTAAAALTGLLPLQGSSTQGQALISTGTSATWSSPLLPWTTISGTTQALVGNQGYITGNTGHVAFTAPTAPTTGQIDSISAGAGGWTLALNPGQTILCGAPVIGKSLIIGGNPVGTTIWNQIPFTVGSWSAIASSADGSHLAATIKGGYVTTSSNYGYSFDLNNNSTSQQWVSIASSSDGSHLAAISQDQGVSTSSDSGVTWIQHSGLVPSGWQHIASSATGTMLAAVSSPSNVIWVSSNGGSTWTAEGNFPASASYSWSSVTVSSDGVHLAAACFDSTINNLDVGGGIYISSDSGHTWSLSSDPHKGWSALAASSDGSHLLAAWQTYALYTSPDYGVTWISHLPSNPPNWVSVASSADGSHLAAVSSELPENFLSAEISLSSDFGTTWTVQTSVDQGALNVDWQGIACSSDGAHLTAVADLGSTNPENPGGYWYTSYAPSSFASTDYSLLSGDAGSSIDLLWMGPATAIMRNARGPVYPTPLRAPPVLSPPPVITSGTFVGDVVNQVLDYQIAATNTPTSFGATPLPAGLGLNTQTGVFTGAPTAPGQYMVTITATNSGGTGSAVLTINVVSGTGP